MTYTIGDKISVLREKRKLSRAQLEALESARVQILEAKRKEVTK